MDSNDSFSSFYPNYFNNQTGSVNSWSPNLDDHESKMGTSSKDKFKSEDEFDYQVLVDSLFNKGSEKFISVQNDNNIDGFNQQNSPMTSFKHINWSDFDDNYLTKSLTRQLAKTTLKSNQTDLLSQLQSDWSTKNNNNQNTINATIPPGLNVGSNQNNNINSVFSRILEDGYETRLNSSRSSDKSTNRTNLPPPNTTTTTIPNVQSVTNNMNGSLVSNLGYNSIAGTPLLGSSLINHQLLNGGVGPIGGINPNLGGVNNLGNNINVQLLRNHLINNQLLNRQLLNNQILSSQMLANQSLFSNNNLANAFRNVAYNGDYLVNGQLVGNNEYMSGEFLAASDYLQSNFTVDPNGIPMSLYDYHNFGYNKFCKPIMKTQLNLKNFKNRQVRKKKNNKSNDVFPLPSLKDAEFDRAVEYLKETLVSLYKDQIMPIYFNVRGRFIEFNTEDIAPEHIMDICKRKPDIFNVVSNGALNETFIYLVEEPNWFNEWVDRNDLTDIYGPDVWEQFFNFIKNYRDEEGNHYFPGSIYGMSRVMQKLKLPFLEGMSLGTLCHIVQLGIRLKKFLIYDLKTLKPSELVKNYQFQEIPEITKQDNESNQSVTAVKETANINNITNAVSDEKSGILDENNQVLTKLRPNEVSKVIN